MALMIFELLRHLRAMWRYRWYGLATAWVLAVAGAVVTMSIPKKYDASARVFVNTDSILKPLMVGMTVQPDNSQRVALLSRLVVSRPNVEQLVDETGLAAKAKTTEQREKLIDTVMQVLEIQSAGEHDNIYMIKFRDTDPDRAKRMVELLVSKFIDSSKGGRATDNDAAKRFLDEQIATHEQKLREAEDSLKNFKLQNMTGTAGVVTGDGKDSIAQLTLVGEQMNKALLDLHEAENSRDAYRRGLAAEDVNGSPTAAAMPSGETIADIDARLDAQKRNLDGLLQKYTEQHPDVVGARRVILELEARRNTLIADYRRAGLPLTATTITGPRASEQLKVSLAQSEAAVASLRIRANEYTARYAALQTAAKRMPEFDAQLVQLNRDYEVNKKNYDNLVARRESAGLASDMQSVSGVADFRLIDPPRVMPSTKSPSRGVMLLGTLLFSLASGAAVMFLMKELRARFYDGLQLMALTGLPLLGVISAVDSEETRHARKKNTQRLMLVTAMLSTIYILVVIAGLVLTKPGA